MSFRPTAAILLASLIAISGAIIMISGCAQGPGGAQAGAYEEPAELNAAHDSLESLASSTGKTLEFEDYKAVYQHFLEQHPNSTDLHRDWQGTMDAFEKSEEKLAHYKELHEQNPESATYAYLYGRCLDAGQERALFEKAIELDPQYFWGHFGYGATAVRNEPVDTAGAIEHLNKAAEIDPTYPATYSVLASVHEARGELDNALKYVKAYSETVPDNYRPIQMQTELLARMDRGSEAENLMLMFASENEENTAVRADLVEHYRNAGNHAEALKWQYDYAAIARDPDAALVDVAKIHLAMDHPDSALYYLNQAAERGYADHRRLTTNADLAAVREVEGFDNLIVTVKENAEAARERRLASFLDNAAENRKDALDEKIGEPAPTFAFENLEGETVALEDLRGKVVVIDFWATWCGPCRMTMPVLQEFVDRADEDVVFLSLNVWEDDQSKVQPYIDEYGYTFNVLLGDNQIATDYGVQGIPTMVVIDPKGMLQYKHVGYDPHLDQILLWQTEHLLGKGGAQAKL